MTLVSSLLTSARNSKGNLGSEGAEWERGRKITQFFSQYVAVSRKQCKIGPKLLLITNRKSHTRFWLVPVPKSSTLDDLEWPWTAKTHSVAEKMRILEPTSQIWMKIDSYYQRRKCRPMILVSGNMRFMGIFVGVPLGGGVKWEWGWRRRQFLAIWVATSSESSEIRPVVLYIKQ